jgi:hypothetical protein
MKEGDHSEDIDIDGKTTLKWNLYKYVMMILTGLFCIRLETSGGLL